MAERITEPVTIDQLTKAWWNGTKKAIYIAPERRKLARGRMSCFYLNLGDVVMSQPDVKALTVASLVQTFKEQHILVDRLIGVPAGMYNLTSSVGDSLYIGQLQVREDLTGHGDQATIEGEYEPKMRVGVLEDVMSTGNSTITRAIEPVKAAGLIPVVVTSIVDRQYGGIPKMRELSLPARAFVNTTGVVESLLRQDFPSLSQIKLLEQELKELTSE